MLPNDFDRQHLKQLPMADLIALIEPCWQAAFGCTSRTEGTVFSIAEWQETFLRAAREEAASLTDMVRLAVPLFADVITTYTPEARQCLENSFANEVLSAFREGLATVEPFNYDMVNQYLRDLRWRFKSQKGLSGQQVMFSIRAALTGTLTGPCLVIMIILLGQARCLQRVQAANLE